MKQQSFQDMAQESDEAFRKQFDPNSECYHGGLKVPVPLNGDRVPQSMNTMYPEGYDPNKTVEVVDFGEGYRKVETQRTIYLNLKKSLAKLCPIVQSFMRHDQIFKDKGDPNNPNHIQVHEENIKKQNANLEAVNVELQAYISLLDGMGEQGQLMSKELKQIIEESKIKYDSKQSLGNFNFKAKKISTQTFASAQKCLQRLKDIKKQHASKVVKKEQKAEPSQ